MLDREAPTKVERPDLSVDVSEFMYETQSATPRYNFCNYIGTKSKRLLHSFTCAVKDWHVRLNRWRYKRAFAKVQPSFNQVVNSAGVALRAGNKRLAIKEMDLAIAIGEAARGNLLSDDELPWL